MLEELIISVDFLWGIFILVILAFLFITWVIHYHFRYYGIKDNSKIFAKGLFWFVSMVLILVAFFAIFGYEKLI